MIDRSLIIALPVELFALAESSSYEGVYHLADFEFGPDTYTSARPLAWHVTITNVGGAFLVEGDVSGTVTTSCSRCLEPVRVPVEGEVEGYFIIPGEGEAPEDMDEDEFDILPASREIDLEPLLLAGIYMELPLMPLCKEDCKGLCPTCGADLNQGSCGCTPVVPDEDFKPNPFAALKDFKFE